MRRHTHARALACLLLVTGLCAFIIPETRAATGQEEVVYYWDENNNPSVEPGGPKYFDMDWYTGFLSWKCTNNVASPAYVYEIEIEEGANGYATRYLQRTGDGDLDYQLEMTARGYTYWYGGMQELVRVNTGSGTVPDTTEEWLKKVKYAGYLRDMYIAGPNGAKGEVQMHVYSWPVYQYPNGSNGNEYWGNWWLFFDPDKWWGKLNLYPLQSNYNLIHFRAP